jgi:hypothetical protein
MQNTIKFTIKPGGAINMEVVGGQGESCMDVTKELEVSLASAGNKTDEGKKPEYYEGGGGISVFNDLN